jgi:uncharacterized repeat protein (TIGR03843 family)
MRVAPRPRSTSQPRVSARCGTFLRAYELADALGWEMVPPTVESDGTFGVGSVQLFVDADFSQHHFTLVEDPAYHEQLQRMCAFDLLANNTDRKSGHVLVAGATDDVAGRVWGIDHGLCFAADFKLRTVIWEFANSAPGTRGRPRFADRSTGPRRDRGTVASGR